MGTMIEFRRPDGASSAGYLAEGSADKPNSPGLILIQEWWGLKPHILDLAERFAAAGYTTLAPDLYRGRIASDADEASHMMGALDFVDACDQDLAGALNHLKQGCPKVGVLGFCMGGALTIAAAVRLPGLAAASCFYGIPPQALADPARIAIPLQGHFADQDDWCTPAVVDAFETALTVPAEIHRYHAQHAFFNNSRPEVYDPAAAALAWQRTLQFFAKNLGKT
jgi:carboxymethylenebutenolidase